MERITGAVGQFRSAVGFGGDEDNVTLRDQDDDQDLYFMDDEFNRSCILSTQQRLYGFAICLSLGLLFFFLSLLVILNPVKFAITFTLGNLLGLGSTGFLIGPKQQLTMMLDPSRIVATITYICSTILALFCALIIRSKLLTLLAIVVEFCALVCFGNCQSNSKSKKPKSSPKSNADNKDESEKMNNEGLGRNSSKSFCSYCKKRGHIADVLQEGVG